MRFYLYLKNLSQNLGFTKQNSTISYKNLDVKKPHNTYCITESVSTASFRGRRWEQLIIIHIVQDLVNVIGDICKEMGEALNIHA